MNRFLCLPALVLTIAGASYAAPITFAGLLSGANENPATGSPGTGSATVTYDSTTHLLSVDVFFSGLEADSTAAHIHCCILPNGNAAIATTVPSFTGFPLGVTSGTFMSTLDLTSAASFNPAFVTSSGGTVADAEAALATGLENGMAYLNLHTTTFPSGEIRAILEPVPEPASALLALTALVGFWLITRARARQ